jgi:cytochrome c-type biogenesis protein CcmH
MMAMEFSGFWVFAGLLAIASTAVLYSGSRSQVSPSAGSSAAAFAIYKDQLAEIERDLKQGLIGAAEAEGQRAEIGRRLLSAARSRDAASSPATGARLPPAMLLIVPLLALAVYVQVGAPRMADLPRAARLAAAVENGDLEALLAQVESHLEKNPTDVTGWKLLVPYYQSLGRHDDAAAALRRIVAIDGPSPALLAELAEALTFANQGLMTPDAEAALREALQLDPKNSKARYYNALALLQNGDRNGARVQFEALLRDSPADAPWRQVVEGQLSRLSNTTDRPGPTSADLEAAQSLSPEDRQAMIRNMVDGLDARLAQDANNLDGWLRLIRARAVLNEMEKAQAALRKARDVFAGDQSAMSAIDALAKELKLL